jgi:hypothetical protein
LRLRMLDASRHATKQASAADNHAAAAVALRKVTEVTAQTLDSIARSELRQLTETLEAA